MEYPKYLSIRNQLFKHVSSELFINNSHVVGGRVPENLYYVFNNDLNLSRLCTFEGIIAAGGKVPDDEKLLRLIKQ